MVKYLKKIMQILFLIVIVVLIGGILYLWHPRFGASATGSRLALMESKPNFSNGAFDNLEHTPALAEGVGYTDILKKALFSRTERKVPSQPIPVVRTDLKNLPADSNLFVWFGHSSYYLQMDGKKILVDPVFSKYATPVRISVRAFDMEYEYSAEDMPEIDLLLITHDHWDHLDYNTFQKLKHKVRHIVTGLGVGAHLEKWGYPADRITEMYWGDEVKIQGFEIASATARHFSGRMFKRNNTLWSSFILKGSKSIYIGGDSGYGKHFKEIGSTYGPFDFVFLDNGQYNQMWKYIHMLPEEVPQAAQDLQARQVIPVHSAKFPLANHPWDEPLIRVSEAAGASGVNLIIPKIGQVVSLDHPLQIEEWWRDL